MDKHTHMETKAAQGSAAGQQRPPFPARAVVTAGMPYGNKALHFGHVGGMFVHADVYARFLRDRIGAQNVIFVSGTDCYGAAIELSYEALRASGAFEGTIEDFVRRYHEDQKRVLDAYGISLDLYAASALDAAGAVHAALSREAFLSLHDAGFLSLMETDQFYDEAEGIFLNGRQVKGRCPIQGCKSEHAYADECALGHQYSPAELIAPVSVVSGKRPVLRGVKNWFFDLERFRDGIEAFARHLEKEPTTRKYLLSVVEEFLRPPMVYVKKDRMDAVLAMRGTLPPFAVASEGGKASDALVFETLPDRARALKALDAAGIRYRTGKTLVPFRLSGNVAWGIPVPEREGAQGLTFWVWPESLLAPISFTRAYLLEQGRGEEAYRDWWCSREAKVYQFIGEDNIYFYSVAQTGLFLALQRQAEKSIDPPEGSLRLTTVVPNRHVLYRNRKASSSSAEKPPTAEALLSHYTKDQLRMHFFHLNLSTNSVSFAPAALSPEAKPGAYDPVHYEGNILTNIFNRLVRSCFYYLQTYFEGAWPVHTQVSAAALAGGQEVILSYERAMHAFAFGKVVDLLDGYLREANKFWAAETKTASQTDDMDHKARILVDAFHAVRVAATLLHPLSPDGTEMIRRYLNVDERLWDWTHVFEPLTFFMEDPGSHRMRHLAPRVDFFKKFQPGEA